MIRPAMLFADITVVARMDSTNQTPTDFYLLPRIDVRQTMLRLNESQDRDRGRDSSRNRRISVALLRMTSGAPLRHSAGLERFAHRIW
jgi:hypothetical protein